jgi:very-long-chain enoyl-CoA reductase
LTYLLGIIYVLVGTATVTKWALAKHKKYHKEFGEAYPKGRKALFPGIL